MFVGNVGPLFPGLSSQLTETALCIRDQSSSVSGS